MLSHLSLLQLYRGPLIALAVALGLVATGRFLRVGWLSASAPGVGVLAGWYTITGRIWMGAAAVSIAQLTGIAAIAAIIGLFCVWRGPGRVASVCSLLAALFVGWLLAGEPRRELALRSDLLIGLSVTVVVLLFVRTVANREMEPLRLALAGLTLAAAFHIVGAPVIWTQLALVTGVAALSLFALPPMPGLVALPVAVDTAALGCLAVVLDGRLPRLGFGPMDAAALSPLLAVWLPSRMADRLRFAGRAAPLAGCLLAGAFAIGCVWLTRYVLHPS